MTTARAFGSGVLTGAVFSGLGVTLQLPFAPLAQTLMELSA